MLTIFLGILAIGILLAPVGCVLLWQRYNYFSDGLAHASIFSGIISYFLDLPHILSMIIISIAFAFVIYIFKFLSNRNNVVTIVSSAFVASAIIISAKMEDKSAINTMLFGDMLSINSMNVIMISILAIISLSLFFFFGKSLILIALDRDIAKLQEIRVNLIELISLIIFGLIVAISVKIIGALLITALLITPAAAARLFSRNPLQMVLFSLLIAIISGISGFILSFEYNLPLSSAIVAICIFIYGMMSLTKYMVRRS